MSNWYETTTYTEVINPIKHMSATHNYRKYITPSLSIYLGFSLYSRSHIIKGIWVLLPPCSGFALSLALPSCHHGRGAGVASVDVGVPDLALASDQIQSVMTGAELGRGSRSRSSLYYH